MWSACASRSAQLVCSRVRGRTERIHAGAERSSPRRGAGAKADRRPTLVLAADATPDIGAGHAMRLASLAERWAESGGRTLMAGVITIPFVRERLNAAGVNLCEELDQDISGEVLVVDSYDERRRVALSRCAKFRARVLVDDLGGPVPSGYDAVWNPNAFGSAELYPNFVGEVLGGAEFVPVRRNLPRWRNSHTDETAVMLGGSQLLPTVRNAMQQLSTLQPERRFRGVGNWVPADWAKVDALNPWPGLVEADQMICAAGVSLWEVAAVGIPAVVLCIAENQQMGAEWAATHGVPTIVFDSTLGAETLARELSRALTHAKPLPPQHDGTACVIERLRRFGLGGTEP